MLCVRVRLDVWEIRPPRSIKYSLKSTQYIDLAKPKSGAPWLFILAACRVSETKRFRIVCVLMFPVAALHVIIK